jgi:hypothetical protein
MTTKYDYALSQFPGKIIVVHCDTCDVDYDVREVTNEVQHAHALHVMSFDCPKGHRSEARRLWKEKAPHLIEGDVVFPARSEGSVGCIRGEETTDQENLQQRFLRLLSMNWASGDVPMGMIRPFRQTIPL